MCDRPNQFKKRVKVWGLEKNIQSVRKIHAKSSYHVSKSMRKLQSNLDMAHTFSNEQARLFDDDNIHTQVLRINALDASTRKLTKAGDLEIFNLEKLPTSPSAFSNCDSEILEASDSVDAKSSEDGDMVAFFDDFEGVEEVIRTVDNGYGSPDELSRIGLSMIEYMQPLDE